MKARLPKEYQQKGNMNAMLAQAQKMQDDIAVLQAELDVAEYTASSGGGMVNVTVTGKHELLKLSINKEIVDPDDIEMMEDLIMAAVNEGIRTAETTAEAEMAKITEGVNIPGLTL